MALERFKGTRGGRGGGMVGYRAQGKLLKIGLVGELDVIGCFAVCVNEGREGSCCVVYEHNASHPSNIVVLVPL